MQQMKLFVVVLVLLAIATCGDAGAKKKYTIANKAEFYDFFRGTPNWGNWDQAQSTSHSTMGAGYQELIDHCMWNHKIGKYRGLTMVMNNSPCKSNKAACHDQNWASCHLRTVRSYSYGHFEAIMRFSHPGPNKVKSEACFSTYVSSPKHNEIDLCFGKDHHQLSTAFFNGLGADKEHLPRPRVKVHRAGDTVLARYSFTWLPGQIRFQVNKKQVAKLTAHEARIPWLAQALVLILRPLTKTFTHSAHQDVISVKYFPMHKKTKRDVHESIEDIPTPTGSQLCAAINAIRVSNQLEPFVVDQGLNHIAGDQASHMSRRQTVTHHPELSRRPIVNKYYAAKKLAESIGSATAATTVANIVKDWMSHSDSKYILGDYEHVGCAVSESTNGRIWFVVEYGSHNETSSNKKFHFELENGFWGQHATSSADVYSAGWDVMNATRSYDLCSSVACEVNSAGTLVCKKSQLCPTATRPAVCPGSCGHIFDGQTAVSCGTCPSGSVCSEHKCVKQSCGHCPDNSVCENGVCACPEGSELKNGNCVRVPFLSLNDPREIESYNFFGGNWELNYKKSDDFHNGAEWSHDEQLDVFGPEEAPVSEDDEEFLDFSGLTESEIESGNFSVIEDMSAHDVIALIDDGRNGIHQTSANSNGIAIWKGSEKAHKKGKIMVFSADVEIDHQTKTAGLVFNFQDTQNYMFMKYAAGAFYFGSVVAGKTEQQVISKASLTLQNWAEFRIVMREQGYEFFVNGKQLSNLRNQVGPIAGAVGVFTEGSAAFANLNLRSRISMGLKASCPDNLNSFADNLAWALRVDTHQLTATCSSDSTIDMIVEGTMDYPAESISKDLITFVNSGAEILAENQINIAAAVMTSDVVLNSAIVLDL